ncbi:MAG: hypothetical protein GWN79_18755 [Actinobacteria bacterium]|nr:hypothetical protein [Actinomycetota bacterium]NIS34206.1 hypothetical protein [Actinomycetota bacterium]NIT97304.1 hypothetical protein [Actinomycetota bacterium]NIU20984.1 hypothetical protein [Actinomycetota bacterium]NIU68979.1 hypothetical protein [Actinomycetota bacterium]
MCATCTTAIDVAGTHAVIVAAAAANGWERVKDRLAGRSRLERRLATWEANAEFVRSLGLDPLATLGAPPAIPGPVGEPAVHTTG